MRDPASVYKGPSGDFSRALKRSRHAASVVRRRVLKDVRAVGNTWARATAPALRVDPGILSHPEAFGEWMPWPAFPPKDYLGQLDSEFQAALARERSRVALEDCNFYHTSVLSTGAVVAGPWDLRGVEAQYIGGINIAGERVLELGPATGALTWFMEDAGAQVVGFDVGFDVCGDILPMPGLDVREQQMNYLREAIVPVQNSWWYLHRDRRSLAKMAYGNIYSLPGDLGTFDTALFGAILLHLRDPFLALQQAAARTTRRIVVTDVLQDPTLDRDQNVSRFGSAGFSNHSIWWTLTPEGIRHMLRFLGFDHQATTYSSHKHHIAHDMSQDPVDMNMFTVIAERKS